MKNYEEHQKENPEKVSKTYLFLEILTLREKTTVENARIK